MRRLLTLMLIATVAACTSESVTAPDRPVTAVTVAPATAPLIVGQSVQLSAVITGGFARSSVTWASVNPAVATVTDSGLVLAKGVGSTTVTASAGGITTSIPVTVTTGAIDRVSVCDQSETNACVPHADLTALGTSAAVRATAYNAIGADVSAACTFTWTPNTANIVTIAFFGDATKRDALVTRAAAGTTSIIVSCNGTPGVFTISGL